MNRSHISGLFSVLLVICNITMVNAQSVVFEDPILERSIRSTLSKLEGDLTESDLDDLVSLEAKGVQSLKGLELAGNLTSAQFSDGNLSDLSPLEELIQLTSLHVSGRGIVNLSAISGLVNLESLSVKVHSVVDLSPISNLANLNQLELVDGSITELEPLSSLESLVNIDLSRNSIVNIDTLSGLQNLVTVKLDENRISNLTPILGLDKLELISAESNNLKDLEGFEDLPTTDGTETTLIELYLRDNQIESLEPLRGKHVQYLDLSLNSISDLTPLPAIPRVAWGKLDVSYNNLDLSVGSEQLAFIYRLKEGTGPGGQTLTIGPMYLPQKSQVADIRDENLLNEIRDALGIQSNYITIEDILKLEELEIVDKGVTSLDGLEHALNLERLIVSGNYIRRGPNLENFQKLTYLDFSNNETYIPPSLYSENIKYLDLSQNLFTSLYRLLPNTVYIESIDVSCNPIDFSEGSNDYLTLQWYTEFRPELEISTGGDPYEKGKLYIKRLKSSDRFLLVWVGDQYELQASSDLEAWEKTNHNDFSMNSIIRNRNLFYRIYRTE